MFGDLVIWKELIKYSKDNEKNILFVSNDRKEDWCQKVNGIDLGPRKELLKEFKKETKNHFYSLTINNFIQKISEIYSVENIKPLQDEVKLIEEEINKSIAKHKLGATELEELRYKLLELEKELEVTYREKKILDIEWNNYWASDDFDTCDLGIFKE